MRVQTFLLGLLGGLTWTASSTAFAAQPLYGYHLGFESRLTSHFFGTKDLASNRYRLNFEQTSSFPSGWNVVGGFRAFVEGVRTHTESQDVTLGDFYFQYKKGPWVMRVGNQQVVWGETFSFFYADIVNPKDLREFALGDPADMRRSIPMINARYVFNESTLQLLLIPTPPFYDQLAPIGEDFALPYSAYVPGANVTVKEDTQPSWGVNNGSPENGELGFRASTQLSSLSASFFYFDYHDRLPTYSAKIVGIAPLTVALSPQHPRIKSYGFTTTGEMGDLLLRGEGVLTQGRFSTDEYVYVLESSYSGIDKWRIHLQWSQDLAPTIVNIASLRLNRSFSLDRSLDFTGSYAPMDRSTLLMIRYQLPLTSQLELKLGGDILLGEATSFFGMFHAGSRVYLTLNAFLSR